MLFLIEAVLVFLAWAGLNSVYDVILFSKEWWIFLICSIMFHVAGQVSCDRHNTK